MVKRIISERGLNILDLPDAVLMSIAGYLPKRSISLFAIAFSNWRKWVWTKSRLSETRQLMISSSLMHSSTPRYNILSMMRPEASHHVLLGDDYCANNVT